MEKVKKENYFDFIEFAKLNTCNTVYPMAIAEGVQRGDIYTDSMEKRRYALFWHVCGFAYLSGNPMPEDLDEIYALMKNESGNNPRRFVLESKAEPVAGYFREKEDIEEHPRYGFRLRKLQPVEKIPEGYELREIDEALLSRIEGRIVPLNFWKSSTEFLTKGKGYCLIKNGEVASVAFSAAVSSRLHAAWTAAYRSATGHARWATSSPNGRMPFTKASGSWHTSCSQPPMTSPSLRAVSARLCARRVAR